jgi:hypothetical protein
MDERAVIPAVNRGVPFVIDNRAQPASRGIFALADALDCMTSDRAFQEREGRLLSIFLRTMRMSLSRDRELTERERRLSAIFEAAHNAPRDLGAPGEGEPDPGLQPGS